MTEHALVLLAVEGVLTDIAAIRARCWVQTLTENDFPVDRSAFARRFDGRGDAAVIHSVEAEFGKSVPKVLVAAYESRARLAFERELRAIPDARGTLNRLRLPLCALSGLSPNLARHALEVVELWDLFAPNLFTTNDVGREPPAPELAQFAAAQMGARVSKSILIDASANGVRAGRAAGMIVFGFSGAPHTQPDEQARKLGAAGAHLVFDRMRELAPLIRARAVCTA